MEMKTRKSVVGREAETDVVSEKLIECCLSGDIDCVTRILNNGDVSVNYIGTVSLSVKCMESLFREEEADEVDVCFREFVTDVTPLFAAAHSGHVNIARMLLSAGADVNQELFRGFAVTAAAREGHCVLLDMLIKAGASRSACESALLEACIWDQAKAVELLICSEMIGLHVAKHALVSASSRGYVDVSATLIENGVDINCTSRVLLRSFKPSLHANINCTPLIAAIVNRQVDMVKYLLEAGVKTDCCVRIGAWSWDIFSGEELRVGACLGEPYNEIWCAVEYYEASGQILNLLLKHQISLLESQQHGRSLLCHAILCQNADAVDVLLTAGADVEYPIRTKKGNESRPLHLAARVGCVPVLNLLISHGCKIDSRTETGDTALMLAAKANQADCFLELINSGADLGLVNKNCESAMHWVKRSIFASSLVNIIRQAVVSRKEVRSTNLEVFSLLHFITGIGDSELLEMVLQHASKDINKHDGLGSTPILIATKAGHTEAFRLLISHGADISVKGRDGQTIASILLDPSYASVRYRFEGILLEALLAQRLKGYSEFNALHFAARSGNSIAIVQLLKMGFNVNSVDDNEYSSLMLAAKHGHADACKLLLQRGAACGYANSRGEIALSLARQSNKCKTAEGVIFDYLARSHVLSGGKLLKHTHEGRGSPHVKAVHMLKSGLLSWGKSSWRTVTCKEAAAGPSASFLKNRKKLSGYGGNAVVFMVLTDTGREIHFEAGSTANLELWVHGINLIAKEATSCGAQRM